MKDVLIILAILGGLIGGLFWLGLTWWAYFVIALAILLGTFEGLARWKTGQTLSQRMWAFRGRRPVLGWVVIGAMALAFVALIVHLAWKTI